MIRGVLDQGHARGVGVFVSRGGEGSGNLMAARKIGSNCSCGPKRGRVRWFNHVHADV